ncbi:MAG: hypothetical protein F4X83_05385 [Chloroflexi bacterium]|nr:hypothetical protein [Chloroflexota bacterium]
MKTTATVKRIVCLANSRKEKERCIAGKEFLAEGRAGGWVRPVSDRPSEAVNAYERQYKDRSEPCVLDIIDVPVLKARPNTYQQENWLLDAGRFWEKADCLAFDRLSQFTDPAAPLWDIGHSSSKGHNDRIPLYLANALDSSLRIIEVDWLELLTSNEKSKLTFKGYFLYKVRGRFRHDGIEYCLHVTDPIYEQVYGEQPNSRYTLDACFLTVSLGGAHKGFAYKLIAAIIAPSELTAADTPIENTAQIPLFTL